MAKKVLKIRAFGYLYCSLRRVKENDEKTFHNTLNSIDPHISFTIEYENNGQISFLDTLVSHNNGNISTDVYTNRYLDFNSHHDKKHKISTARTLIHRASNLLKSAAGITQEFNRLNRALQSNGYPAKLISDITNKENTAFYCLHA